VAPIAPAEGAVEPEEPAPSDDEAPATAEEPDEAEEPAPSDDEAEE
jgi:hypothetical protein